MNISLAQAKFIRSASSAKDFPTNSKAEIAFCGRSNAGKSSAINALCQQKGLARTSKTPGRTQLLNFFQLDGDAFLVDLPGYGYAKAPLAAQKQWHTLVEDYLLSREPLAGLILLMDSRHPLTDIDRKMIAWSKHYQLPLYILLTKCDKLKRNQMMKSLTYVTSTLEQEGLDCAVQAFSATKKTGLTQASNKISDWLSAALEND